MRIEFKEELKTTVSKSAEGYVFILQDGAKVKLSGGQVEKIVKWLQDGNGLALESDWNNGVVQADS